MEQLAQTQSRKHKKKKVREKPKQKELDDAIPDAPSFDEFVSNEDEKIDEVTAVQEEESEEPEEKQEIEEEDNVKSINFEEANTACALMVEATEGLVPKQEIEQKISDPMQNLSLNQIKIANKACESILHAAKNIVLNKQIIEPKEKIIIPFTDAQFLEMIGSKEIILANEFAVKFQNEELQCPSLNHPLYESLMEYQTARSHMLFNTKDVNASIKTCENKLESLWSVKTEEKKQSDFCPDYKYFQVKHTFQIATLQNTLLAEYLKDLRILRNKASELHSLYSHSVYMHQIQVEEILWMSITQGEKAIKESFRILFWVMRNPKWGSDRYLRNKMRVWCCSLSEALLKQNYSLQNVLYILHHILELQHGIGWALHLIQCNIESSNDIVNALCLLNAIFSHSTSNKNAEDENNSSNNNWDKTDIPIASEATDESLWIIVDSDGEDDILEIGGKNSVLGENDLLGFLRQIPFEKIYRNLLLIRKYNSEDIFCGENLTSNSILKVFATCQLLLSTFKLGLTKYSTYQELTKELCRLTLHSIMYCTDLWESASANCDASILERLMTEYNSIFMAAWSTLKSANFQDTSTMFLSEMPFSLVSYEIVKNITDDMCTDLGLFVSDSISCFYSMVCLSNIAINRNEDDLVKDIIQYLFKIGFASDFSELCSGEWARNLCGTSLSSNLLCLSTVLMQMPKTVKKQWLESLPISNWRPHQDELLAVLNSWSEDRMDLMPSLLKLINWNTKSGVDRDVHIHIALFLCSLEQKLKITSKNNALPEWFYDIILLLKLHTFDWNVQNYCPAPESLPDIDTSGKFHLSSIVTILYTTWGHLVPLILQDGAPLILKIVNAGRYKDAVHLLYYVLPELASCPQTIAESKVFNEILSSILKAEKTYSKKAVRFISGESTGLPVKLLLSLIQCHLKNYVKFNFTSPAPLLLVWIYWLTSIENWQSDWIVIQLLDTALKHCFLHPEAMGEAAKLMEKFVETFASPKSPTSSSGIGSWLFSGSNTFKGLILCNMEVPFLWHLVTWIEHNKIERSTGLWKRLMEKLVLQKDGSKVNLDKTFKSVGGADNASALVIYRSLQNAISVSLDCPIYSLLWQIFFYLYLDLSIISNHLRPTKILGTQFFQGGNKNRLIMRAKQRLEEAVQYHEAKIRQLTEQKETENIKDYHSQQLNLMKTFQKWLDEDFFSDLTNPRTFTFPFSQKCQLLISGQNVLWIDTVDTRQLNNGSNIISWPECIVTEYLKLESYHSINFMQSSKAKSGSSTPSDRILLRIKTYEVPLVENKHYSTTEIRPLLAPTLLNDFNKVQEILKFNLNEVLKYSKAYNNMCRNLNTIDDSVSDLIKNLYKHSPFVISKPFKCNSKCLGTTITVSGSESTLNVHVKKNLGYNRTTHQNSLKDALKPYSELAVHTAKITKICLLACNDPAFKKLYGEKLFHIVLLSLKGENMDFPPTSQILDSVATQLGETFISVNGPQCINLINKCEKIDCVALVRSLLRPSKLSTEDMLEVYSTIVNNISGPHVAFSFLSKFNIFSWLCDFRPTYPQRSKLLTIQCEALGAAGFEPPNERIILYELLCVHLSKILAWEFPVHLNQVLTNFTALSIDKKLPPNTWQHVFTVIETYPSLITQPQALEIMQMIGHNWWMWRTTNEFHGLYNRFSIYDYSIARLGALLSSCVLRTAMLHQPPLLTSQISGIVFNAMISFWNAWLAPWWGGQGQAAQWTGDLGRQFALMPWSPDDANSPDVILNALVETIAYCIHTLPGSTNDFLRHIWQWYVECFIQGTTPLHILNKIHRALEKLPWGKENSHWMSYLELQMMVKVSKYSQSSCQLFATQCLGNINWLEWYNMHPQEISSSFLGPILPLLFRLKPSQQVLDNAMLLPWSQLKFEQFQDIVIWYTVTLSNSAESFHSNMLIPLICQAGGLVKNSESSAEWQSKRGCLVRGWVNAISSHNQTNANGDKVVKDQAIVGSNITDLLERIESTIMTLENATELQKLVECSFLISDVVTILNMTSLLEIAQQEWLKWIKKAPKLCIFSFIGCLLQVTQRDTFACLAEEALSKYLKLGGEWTDVTKKWNDSYIVPVEYLITNSSLLTAFGTYKSLNRERFQGNVYEQLDKNIFETLKGFEPSCSTEAETCLWICQMIHLMCDNSLDVPSQKSIIAQNSHILDKWSQEPTWGLLKAIRIVQDTTPSPKFRIVTRYALCVTLAFAKLVYDKENTEFGESYDKNLSMLETTIAAKSNAEFKSVVSVYVTSLKDQNNSIADFLKIICNTCEELYQDSCYCKNLGDVFKL